MIALFLSIDTAKFERAPLNTFSESTASNSSILLVTFEYARDHQLKTSYAELHQQ